MKVIHKYSIISRNFDLDMPQGAQIISVVVQSDGQDEQPVIYAIVDPSMPLETREFFTIGTGQDIDFKPNMQYISTFQLRRGRWIAHLFEVTTTVKQKKLFHTITPYTVLNIVSTTSSTSISRVVHTGIKRLPLRVKGKRSVNVIRVNINGQKTVIWKKLSKNVINE
jgi:hypothetical protein